jgi:hypothetical protein
MRIKTLEVSNFRAVRYAVFNELPSMVVIAGPNGCGKSCLFDAIRLLKSAYGGYQPNEWQHWFSEFQINIDRRQPELLSLFQDRSNPVSISFDIALTDNEISYISDNINDLLRPLVWYQVAPEIGRYTRTPPLAAQFRQHLPEVESKIQSESEMIIDEISSSVHSGRIVINPDLTINLAESPVLQMIFSIFDPQNVGIFEYHGAQRNYQREQIGNVNLNIETSEQQGSQHALYNYANKFTNIKSEMASSYVRDLISREVDEEVSPGASLTSTLTELFETFFPGKNFLGPRPMPNGRLLFPVRTDDGFEHDINDLSSGEKEVLYGYLRLYNLSPMNSVLLVDEPELHLNPRLIQGLPQFYDKHLGRALNNQIWLLTHSDALLREALSSPDFAVFHMQLPALIEQGENQVTRIHAEEDLDRAIMDLVGDLATYRPGAKVVILEGGGDSDFDLYMVTSLFPDFQNEVNPVSAGNKSRVIQLNEVLRNAKKEGAIPASFYAIVDKDTDEPTLSATDGVYCWDRYHIENYLLEPRFILQAIQDSLGLQSPFESESEVEEALRNCAEATQPSLVRESLESYVNKKIVAQINTRSDPHSDKVLDNLKQAIENSIERITKVNEEDLSAEALERAKAKLEEKLDGDLKTGEWRRNFRGRDILRLFVGRYVSGTKYEVFRNLIISKMRDRNYRPPEMEDVIQAIVDA